MGIDVGAYNRVFVSDEGVVVMEGYYDHIEEDTLEYPNGEIVEIAFTVSELSGERIDLLKYLVETTNMYENPKDETMQKQVRDFSREKALMEVGMAMDFVKENKEEVERHYVYNHAPLDVLQKLKEVWMKGYIVEYSY